MRTRFLLIVTVVLLATVQTFCFAQRGGRGGGGGGRGAAGPRGGGMGGPAAGPRPGGGPGGPGGGPRMNSPAQPHGGGGGFGGGLQPNAANRKPEGREGMGAFGQSGVAHPGAAGAAARPSTARPGAAARPGNGTLPGTGARPGVAANGTAAENAAQARPGVGALPGYGVGRPGVPGYGVDRAYGTRYMSSAALADQAAVVRAADYRTYNAAMYASYATAWTAANYTNASLYTHPGYGALATGLKMDAQPVPYDYGGNVVVQGDGVYVNGDPAGTTQEYADQASQLAAAGASAEPPENSKWLPLGVFALVEGDATNSDDVFQIAVNPQGIIRGNYHQVSTDSVVKISGSVDRKTQRASFTIGDDKMPVYDTGVANLTKDAAPILIHLEDGQTQQMNLVRLEEPQQ